MNWKKLGTKITYQNPYFSVEEADVIRPDNSRSVYYTVLNRKGVGVIAYDGNKVLMVNQYRIPIEKRIWSFVAGGAEHVDLLEDAKRELLEEAGFTAQKWTLLGTFPTSPSLTDQTNHIYIAEGLIEGQHVREAGEMDMEVAFFTFEEVDELIEKGELSAFDISDFYMFKKYLEKNK